MDEDFLQTRRFSAVIRGITKGNNAVCEQKTVQAVCSGCENNFYTMKGLVYTSDGTDYTDLVRKEMGMTDENGTTPIRLDAEKAEQYKQQAIEELTAAGVTFPVEVDYYVSASQPGCS